MKQIRHVRVAHAILLGSGVLMIAAVSFSLLPLIPALISCLLGCAMLAVNIIDMQHMIIPDVISLPAIPAGLLAIYFVYPEPDAAQLVLHNLAACLAAGLVFYVIGAVYLKWRGYAGLGLGDVKLAAVAGAWTGPHGVLIVVLLACLAALGYVVLVLARRDPSLSAQTALPFGAFLAPAIWLVWFANAAGFQVL